MEEYGCMLCMNNIIGLWQYALSIKNMLKVYLSLKTYINMPLGYSIWCLWKYM